MLSIKALSSSGAAQSYFEKDDYYARPGETPEAGGTWFGKGAAELGLTGKVDSDQFKELLDGHLPNGVELGTIREKGGEKEHRPGWDLTFSAPKSVSILALAGGDERLRTAHDEAVAESLTWLESNIAGHRKKSVFGTEHKDSDNITVALFQHATSREKDPALHTHSVVLNINKTDDDKWRSINSERFYEYKMALGNIYRAALASRVQSLGYDIERVDVDGRWELKAVEPEVREHFSQRRAQIEAAMERFGVQGPEAAERMALMTRRSKTTSAIEQLQEDWSARNQAIGFDPAKTIEDSKARGRVQIEDGRSADKGVQLAVSRLADKEAVFSHARLLQWSLAGSMGHGRVNDVEKAIADTTESQTIRPTRLKGSKAFTTPAAIKTEGDVIELWRSTQGSVPAPMERKRAYKALAAVAKDLQKETGEGFPLNEGQTEAAVAILTSKDRFSGVIGRPGVGKTTMLGRVRPVLEKEGYEPVGLAGNANAARTIQEESGIRSGTLASHLRTVRGLASQYDKGNAITRASILAKTSKQVWIIDEASQINARDARRTMKLAIKLNARVVMMGDDKQLAAIEAGQPFAQLVRKGMKTATITENKRQRRQDHKDAVHAATEGKVSRAMQLLDRDTHQVPNGEKRIARIVTVWAAMSDRDRAKTAVLTARNAERTTLNEAMRDVLRREGKLRGEVDVKALTKASAERVDLADVLTYRKGDIIAFGRSNSSKGTSKEAVYEVQGVDRERRHVELRVREGENPGQTLTWSPSEFAGMARLGVSLFRERATTLAPDEKIQWGKNMSDEKFSDGSALMNGAIYQVDAVSADRLQLRNRTGATIQLDPKTFSGQVWDHALATTTYKGQGRTEDHALVNAESNRTELFSQKGFLVAVSRHRDSITLFTDNTDKFTAAVLKHDGEKTTVEGSAMELHAHNARRLVEQGAALVRSGADAARNRLTGGGTGRTGDRGTDPSKTPGREPDPAVLRR